MKITNIKYYSSKGWEHLLDRMSPKELIEKNFNENDDNFAIEIHLTFKELKKLLKVLDK